MGFPWVCGFPVSFPVVSADFQLLFLGHEENAVASVVPTFLATEIQWKPFRDKPIEVKRGYFEPLTGRYTPSLSPLGQPPGGCVSFRDRIPPKWRCSFWFLSKTKKRYFNKDKPQV